MDIQPVAIFHSPLSSKFGIPKQSGLVEELEGTIVFTEIYRSAEALRGIECFDYRRSWEAIRGSESLLRAPRSDLIR